MENLLVLFGCFQRCDFRHCVGIFFLYHTPQFRSVRDLFGGFYVMPSLFYPVGGSSVSGFMSGTTIPGGLDVIKNFFGTAQNIFSGLLPDANEDFVVSFHDSPRQGCREQGDSSDCVEKSEIVKKWNRKTSYAIRLANTQKQKKAAKELIGKMYSWRNYQSDNILQENPRLTTFVAHDEEGRLSGTITVGLDAPEGLFADEVYKEELASLRTPGRRVCEFIGLAVAPEIRSQKVLGGLFHVAMIYASKMFNHTDVVFEVSPRHGRFYEKMLGMKLVASGRICPRVNTASVLFTSEFSYGESQIEKVHRELLEEEKAQLLKDRSLYRHFFNGVEEAAILRRFDELLKKEESSLQPATTFSSLSTAPIFASN